MDNQGAVVVAPSDPMIESIESIRRTPLGQIRPEVVKRVLDHMSLEPRVEVAAFSSAA